MMVHEITFCCAISQEWETTIRYKPWSYGKENGRMRVIFLWPRNLRQFISSKIENDIYLSKSLG